MHEKLHVLYYTRLVQWLDRVKKAVCTPCADVEATIAVTDRKVCFEEKGSLHYEPVQRGQVWGSAWQSAWFELQVRVPQEKRDACIALQIDIGGEALLYSQCGQPLHAFSSASVFDVEFVRDWAIVYPRAHGNEVFHAFLEGTASGLFGVELPGDPAIDDDARHGHFEPRVKTLSLVVFDKVLWSLSLDVEVLLSLYASLPEGSIRKARILHTLMRASNAYADDGHRAAEAQKVLHPLLQQQAHASSLQACAVGHAHIDTAWLWPVDESIRKIARTFVNQLNLLEQYPSYIFGSSAPQHLVFLQEHYPALFEKVKCKVAEGRWELQGGMWVEADCNIPSGESLVRQFLYGKNYYKDEFGEDVKNLWLPDVFGYSAALPQIMKGAGVDYFLTQKLSWNQFNTFPHHTFLWRGIDGSEVITHFPPENTYNSALLPMRNYKRQSDAKEGLVFAEQAFVEKDKLEKFMVLFGVGDGGGGPTAEQIERGMRMQNLEGCPQVLFCSARNVFAYLEENKRQLEVWQGELYLELHRGTLTTQAANKKNNRKLEFALQAIEALAVSLTREEYPKAVLERVWKTALLNQFHDIIPGSSIRKVYETTDLHYAECFKLLEEVKNTIISEQMEDESNTVLVYNPWNFNYTTQVALPRSWQAYEITMHCEVVCTQLVENTLWAEVQLEAGMWHTLVRGASASEHLQNTAESLNENTMQRSPPYVLENDYVRYVFNAEGRMTESFDKELQRNLLCDEGNVLSVYEDRPANWDAWDIDIYYRDALVERVKAKCVALHTRGEIRQELEILYEFEKSRITQRVVLRRSSKRLDFCTKVAWYERHRMLRVSFPTIIKSDCATFDIQYGFLHRSQHENTSFDKAQFEVCGHKYADLSTSDFGVALLNDCKYGYRVKDGVLDLHLLRSPTMPDADADRGEHEFVYALLPHTLSCAQSVVRQESFDCNRQPLVFLEKQLKKKPFTLAVDSPHIDVVAVKKAEKSENAILRLVEGQGRHCDAQIFASERGFSFVEVDLLEWNETGMVYENGDKISFTPFEIKTLKLVEGRYEA